MQGRIEFNGASEGLDGFILSLVGLLLYAEVKPCLCILQITEHCRLVL
jgi:hypothetical protein